VIGCALDKPLRLEELHMVDDERCCGTGTCIINAEGYCWCGQKWDGQKMCFPDRQGPAGAAGLAAAPDLAKAEGESE
jgi:hypothetical protein